jgi:DNA-binding NarL/FixJ family response regulator
MSVNGSVHVMVHSTDPVLRDGVSAQLRGRSEVVLADDDQRVAVEVLACDRLDDEHLVWCRNLSAGGVVPIVVVLSTLDDPALLAGFEAGVRGFVRRSSAVPERLVSVIVAVAGGDVSVPPDLVGGLLLHLSRVQAGHPSGRDLGSLSAREADVLRLASQGLETSEIARELAYSERTVKGVVHDVTSRFQLKNRTHAVAFALKEGMI